MHDRSKIRFHIRGPGPDPYTVTVERGAPGDVIISCTCPVGSAGGYCKHRFGILRGYVEDVISENAHDVGLVHEWRRSGP